MHPFCFALDPAVVVIIDVLGNGFLKLVECLEFRFVAIEHLVLHHPEERFHYAVVDAVPLSGHGLNDAFFPEPLLIIVVLVKKNRL